MAAPMIPPPPMGGPAPPPPIQNMAPGPPPMMIPPQGQNMQPNLPNWQRPFKSSYEVYTLRRADPEPGQRPSWRRYKIIPNRVPANDMGLKVKTKSKHSVTQQYDGLSSDSMRDAVDRVVDERNFREENPGVEWEISHMDVTRKALAGTFSSAFETTQIRLLLKRKLRSEPSQMDSPWPPMMPSRQYGPPYQGPGFQPNVGGNQWPPMPRQPQFQGPGGGPPGGGHPGGGPPGGGHPGGGPPGGIHVVGPMDIQGGGKGVKMADGKGKPGETKTLDHRLLNLIEDLTLGPPKEKKGLRRKSSTVRRPRRRSVSPPAKPRRKSKDDKQNRRSSNENLEYAGSSNGDDGGRSDVTDPSSVESADYDHSRMRRKRSFAGLRRNRSLRDLSERYVARGSWPRIEREAHYRDPYLLDERYMPLVPRFPPPVPEVAYYDRPAYVDRRLSQDDIDYLRSKERRAYFAGLDDARSPYGERDASRMRESREWSGIDDYPSVDRRGARSFSGYY